MTALPWDAAVARIMETTRVDRARAEQVARLNGFTPPAPDPAAARDAAVLEKAEQLEVAKLFRSFGFKVYWLSQARAAKQTPGIPDLWCMHEREMIAFWFEVKRQKGGRFSAEQLEFRELAVSCGVRHHSGDRYDAQELLITLGLAFRDPGALEPVRTPS